MKELKHGTVGGYNNHKCRCPVCALAVSEYNKKYLKTPRGKAVHAKSNAKYSKTPEGKATQAKAFAKWYKSPGGKINKAEWFKSPEGKTSRAKTYTKYAKNNLGKCNAKSAKRHALKFHATPPWLTKAQLKQIETFYLEAQRLTKETGIIYSVDHIWPLKGKGFTGLHVPWNLNVITLAENMKKSNRRPTPEEYSNKNA